MRNLAFSIHILLLGTLGTTFQLASQEFVIDQTMPYVYIKLDHVGTRTPILEGESTKGLWLRLVNNCRVPISVISHDTGTRDPGVAINHEVVPNDIASIPTLLGPESTPPDRDDAKAPPGYLFHVGTRAVIPPGGTLLFSVPANHVSPSWFLRVPFTLVPANNHTAQPSSQAVFTWTDLPEKFRALGHAPVSPNPTKR
jgi:hypothetical protein